jgi:hypothetical protein
VNKVIARCNGAEIVESGDEVWLVWKPVLSPVWVFVSALCVLVFVVNGTLFLAKFTLSGVVAHGLLGAFLLLGALLSSAVCRWALRKRAADVERVGSPFLILRAGQLLDAQRRKLAELEQVSLERTFQLTSSSRALAIRWPGGSAVVARGNPFGESVDACESALLARGLRSG